MRASTVGKILGALGLVALLSAPYTYLFTANSALAAGAKLALGVALIGAFFATNVGKLSQFASRKSTFFFVSSVLLGLAVLAALGALNFIVFKRGKTWDLTHKQIYTLAPQTRSALAALPDKVTLLGFVTPGMPGFAEAEALLTRYRREAPQHFDFSFQDPKKRPDLAERYHVREGQLTFVLTHGGSAKETHSAINLVLGQELLEQDVTNALLKLGQASERKVYVLVGEGEWPLESDGSGEDGQSLSELKKSMQQEGYAPQTLNLAGASAVPRDAAAVILAGARSKLNAAAEQTLANYLDEGGRLLAFAEAEQDMGLKPLLARYGVEVDSGVMADDHFKVQSPYVLLSDFYSEHSMVMELKRLQLNVEMPTARGLSVLKTGLSEGVVAEPVVLSSPYAWEETNLTADPTRSSGEKSGSIPLVVASHRKISESPARRFDEARLVVMGDSELLVDANWGHEPNRNLVMNALAWATNQTAKLTIRPPDRDISTLDVTDAMLSKIRFASMDVLPLSLLGLGLAVWLRRRDQ